MNDIVCYVSGHGFGHAARVVEVLRALGRLRPATGVAVRTPLARGFFDFNLEGAFDYERSQLDSGVAQFDSLTVDVEGTLHAYARIASQSESTITKEVAALAAAPPRVVLADIPALAFDVAERIGAVGVGLANFSWDWIYADYVRDFPAYQGLVAGLAQSYGRASLLLRLPMHGDLSAFRNVRDIPLVARRATVESREVRRRLDLPGDRRLVLLSFGGIGLSLETVPDLAGITFLMTRGVPASGASCRVVSDAAMTAAGLRYEDLVGASDAVMTKPGYGIVAECIANATPIVYTPRGRFVEYDCLVEGIREHLVHALLSNEDLRAGRWKRALDEVLGQPHRAPGIATDGARVAAEVLSGLLGDEPDQTAPASRRRRMPSRS